MRHGVNPKIWNDGMSHETKNVDEKANDFIAGYHESYGRTKAYNLTIERRSDHERRHTY